MEFSSEWFDESSKAWMLNKRKLKYNCVYKYRCQVPLGIHGKICNKDVYKTHDMCRSHWARLNNH